MKLTRQNTLAYIDLHVDVQHSSEASVALLTGEFDGEDYTWTGAAKVTPGDKWDKEVGEKLAISRALMKAAVQLNRQANGRMKCLEDNAQQSRDKRKFKSEAPTPVKRRRFLRSKESTTSTL